MRYRIIFCLVAVVLLVGTVSADTLILYIDDDAQDGSISETSDADFFTLRNDAGHVVLINGGASTIAPRILATTTANEYSQLDRSAFIFNTSRLDDTAIINSAVLSLYGGSRAQGLGTPILMFTTFNPASNTTLAIGDYDSFTNTIVSTNYTYASWTASAYNNITISDLSTIDKTGFLRIMGRTQWDVYNTTSGLTWLSSSSSRFVFADTYTTGTDNDPFITITYTSGATPPAASFTLSKNFIRIPDSVTATDTSTNTPTSWAWSWGDGTANSTTQNPTHQYLKRGKWDIILTATNAGGSGTTGTTSVKVVGYENN